MLQTLGSLLMVVFLLAYLALCRAFYRKRQTDLVKDRQERQSDKNLSLWKPDTYNVLLHIYFNAT